MFMRNAGGCAGVFERTPRDPVLYLDFDGVLHPGFTRTFEHAPALGELLAEYEPDIILITNLRLSMSLPALRALLPAPLSRLVVGTLPDLERAPLPRHAAILDTNARYDLKTFLVLDDMAMEYPENFEALFQVDPATGLDAAHLTRLLHRLASTFGQSKKNR